MKPYVYLWASLHCLYLVHLRVTVLQYSISPCWSDFTAHSSNLAAASTLSPSSHCFQLLLHLFPSQTFIPSIWLCWLLTWPDPPHAHCHYSYQALCNPPIIQWVMCAQALGSIISGFSSFCVAPELQDLCIFKVSNERWPLFTAPTGDLQCILCLPPLSVYKPLSTRL